MLVLSKKQMILLLAVILLVAAVASMTVIRAANPGLWQHILSVGPDIISHF